MELLRAWFNRLLGLFGLGSQKPTQSPDLKQPSLFENDSD